MIKTANCLHCGATDMVENMYKVKSPSKNYFYVCNHCQGYEASYHAENGDMAHKPAKHGLTLSVEFETSIRNDDSNLLYQYGFLPSSDGSIGGTEWKSPIYTNISGLAQMFKTIEGKVTVGSDCGTHTNVGTFNGDQMQYIVRFYHSLFMPLCEYMASHTSDTVKLFGRDFTYYASTINSNSTPTRHENFINVQHNTHLEFRLAKFRNAEQYMRLIKMCMEMTKAVKVNFIDHFNDNREGSMTMYRKHKASVTAKKLVSIFKKYAENI